jgi:hypothetical protein
MSTKYSGSIVGEELSGYVQDQITTRQIAHGSGWNGQRTPEQITYLNSRTAWVKLASGTYLTPEKLASMGFVPTAQEQFQGTGLAKNHILFGGYASLVEGNLTSSPDLISGNGTFDVYQRTNFLGNNGAYTAGQDFGIVPMPGIESLDVKALNRGSLKKAIVKIKVQDRNQLNILDVLYLRLGYTVLLEWGNSIFLDNNGRLQQVADTILENDQLFFNPEWNQDKAYDDILQYIENYREIYAGNYDGLLGKVSNFNWTFNKDGSYDVELTILSYGDIIESLKTNITAKNTIYNAVDKGATSYLKGRTVEDHRTDNVLFTMLKFFEVLSANDKYKSDKLTIDGTKKGFFVSQGDPETKFETKKITFEATYTLNRLNSDNTTAPVKNNEFDYYLPEYHFQDDKNGNFTYDGIQSKVKELFEKDKKEWSLLQRKAFFGVPSPTNVAPIFAPTLPSETTQMTAGQPSTGTGPDPGAPVNASQLAQNIPIIDQPEYNYVDPPVGNNGTMYIPTVNLGDPQTFNTFPSPAYYMGERNYTGIIRTPDEIVNTAAGKYVKKFPIFTWPNRYYLLKQLFNSKTEKFTYSATNQECYPVSLGAGASPDDSTFKFKYLSKGSSTDHRYQRITTYKFYDSGATSSEFVSFEYPKRIWGILSGDLQTIYDGLESKWSSNSNGTRFTLSNSKLKRSESPIGPDSGTDYASFSGTNVPANWPDGTYTPNGSTVELEKAWKEFQEKTTPDFPAPKYDNNGNPIDNEFEFFHRFVASNESNAKDQGKPFFWSVKFKRSQKILSTETVENPIYTISPYDPKGFCVLDLDEGKQYYIRFGFLLQIMEDKAILKIDKNKLTVETYDQNPPIIKIAYNTGSFDMLCLPNQMSFDLGKAIVRRDNVLKTWTGGKNSIVFPELVAWSNEDNSEVNTQEDYNKNVADMMNVYLNTDFVGQCMLSATDERGNMATYQFINNICIGLNKALTGVNNIEPVIDETTNTLYLIDSTPKYDYKKAKNKEGKYELQLYGYQAFGTDKNSDGIISSDEIETYESTFARKIDLKTAITPEYASMIAIGATAAGYAKGIEATSFAKWNTGIEDRFKRNFIPGDKTFVTGSTDYKQDIISSYQQIMQDTFYALGIV